MYSILELIDLHFEYPAKICHSCLYRELIWSATTNLIYKIKIVKKTKYCSTLSAYNSLGLIRKLFFFSLKKILAFCWKEELARWALVGQTRAVAVSWRNKDGATLTGTSGNIWQKRKIHFKGVVQRDFLHFFHESNPPNLWRRKNAKNSRDTVSFTSEKTSLCLKKHHIYKF